MKTRILIFGMLLTGWMSFAQQDAQYTQYMYNTININPAYAGSRGVMSFFGLHRTQWVGLDGAPVTNAFSMNTPIEFTNLGLGLSFVNDRIGPTSENTISADVSYSVQTSENYKLSFGVKATGNLFNLDVTRLTYQNPNDPLLQNLNNNFSMNVGAGVYFHSDKSYVGLSVPNFFETKRYDDNDVAVYKERMNFYLIGGYVFDLSPNLKFKPAFLSKVVEGAPFQLDVSGNFLIQEKLTLGAAWRWGAAMSAMVGFQITDGLFAGYAYDLETTRLANYNSGSHEIFLRFELFRRDDRIVSPRFF
ncbi:type IX secretion system membrane protein, PorP/SprF family [Flavobacterium fontis]|jgi:type IX secretion system PorP/SprF family membrane protein|uniref:Type IX secretion system membrane protein, PorP/SprF family n=1 Tax=Flavobacterium fontis TaxID=1124188 RepID=A0A1M5END6_9FLAO|nr:MULTISPECIES: type IX secretion system membrane protein PorP/SprF [Flavobacterium]MCZ8145030.1 type IX secretion system membrane protein PorP/SprF [Flavobacterium sp.]MCZ8368032.1 type IX secretion system membrane protein PorP/SprF [Flavobacterium sp.]SHF80813.1 type IX secretion system membrane protein, PorP/SprF family [Flavobacterium fontis]